MVAQLKDGSPARDLLAADFRLLDNKREQEVQLAYSDQPLSLAVVVQTNSDVRGWLPEVRRTKSLLDASLIGATGEASLTTCNDEVTVIQSMTADIPMLDKAFSLLSGSGQKRRCLDAMLNAVTQLENTAAGRRRVILLIAQSSDVGSSSHLSELLTKTEMGNITVYQLVMPIVGRDFIHDSFSLGTVHDAPLGNGTGIEGGVDLTRVVPEIFRAEKRVAGQDEMMILTSELGGTRIPFRKVRDLESGIAAIGRELHTGYVLSFTPNGKEEGYHQLQVRAVRPGVVVRARPGYYMQ